MPTSGEVDRFFGTHRVDVERPGRFYALGNYGQYLYVAPDADAVIVRVGRDWGVDNHSWLATFRGIADQLAPRP